MNDIEFSSAAEIKAFQEDLLHKHLVYLKKNSPYYRRVFDSYGININKIVYPLKDAELTRRFPLGVSNRIEADRAEITCGTGTLLVMESKL